MLMELSIKNFAIIRSLTVPFEKGLTVLTGETGAGKSIIIDAIALLLGGRGSAEFVRFGEKRAEIEGLFAIGENHPALKKLDPIGVECEEGMLILRRDITDAGKSICRINGKLTTIGMLREVGQTLIDMHGQHEHQSLMRIEEHVELLDSFGGEALKKTRAEYTRLFNEVQKMTDRINSLNQNSQEMARKADLYAYQLQEIEQAKLTPGEDEELLAKRYKLANSEKLYEALTRSYEHMYGEERGLDYMSGMLSHLETAASMDKELAPLYEQMSSSYYMLEEGTYAIREAIEAIDFDPETLAFIETRLAEIDKLKRKYGDSVETILEYAATIEEELEAIEHKDDRLANLTEKRDALVEDLLLEAEALTDLRKAAAAELMEAIEKQLQDLYMEKAQFQVAIEPYPNKEDLSSLKRLGQDRIEFMISANPGEPLKPLAKVASGGELSRIMLALKSVFSAKEGMTSVIFDEVDTGVSGRVAQAIGEKIQRISAGSQVLCISHLPQVAALADHHLYISKTETDNRVFTSVKVLNENEKVDELARMLSGVEVTDLTRKNAEELLALAQTKKM
ncbi:DNA repair protein RecN [Shouchella clausii]|uniref:DNA repair protein RecN n=1 Tax=Shouchella clausii TaxID=79880 RepID=UPI000BA6F826|nr:DNA repair protein RecN [Shouchella clausii]MBX0317673.1 DNA repair protein RecN [Shouchella clausii]MCM3313187.1 DNA repair protein RecN [Psychrobacillus sp. MER TA 17]PAF10240.1 DNA repair protein RecN [Shouchella clausii]